MRAQQTYKAATGATVADLPQILTALLAADNDVRGSAEATLRNVARDANVVPALLTHARGDPDPQVRQLAAVVLKRRVLGHWPRLPRDAQEQVKHILLDGVVKEPVGLVRRSIADVVSKVAKATVPMGQWNALPEFLAQCTQSPEEAHRDVAFVIFVAHRDDRLRHDAALRHPRRAVPERPKRRIAQGQSRRAQGGALPGDQHDG